MYQLNSFGFADDLDDSSLSDTSSEFSDNSSLNESFFERTSSSRHRNLYSDSLESLDEIEAENEAGDFMAFSDTNALCDDLRIITEMSEMCDVKFLVGNDRVPVYGVKAILATRSRFFYNLILSHQKVINQEKRAKKKKSGLISKLTKWTRKSSSKKMDNSDSSKHLIIQIDEFDPETFRHVMLYIHSGRMNVTIKTVIGVMNAADTYGLEDLRSACFQFARRCIHIKTVLPLLTSTERYGDFKWTKYIVSETLGFIAENAQDVLQSPDFEHLPKSAAILILTRPHLQTTEETKWDTALQWSRRHCHKQEISFFRSTIKMFTSRINFCDIPRSKINREILPLSILPDDVINRAMECQTESIHLIGRDDETSCRNDVVYANIDNSQLESISVRRYMDRKLPSLSESCSKNSLNSESSDSGFESPCEHSSML